MKLGLVVATLGRLEPLARLLDSLDGQLDSGDRLVVVAQRNLDQVQALVGSHPLSEVVTVTTSPPGASRGRNVGVEALPLGDRVLMFPNDTTWFPPGAIAALRDAIAAAPFELGAVSVVDEHGPKFELPAPGTPLDRWNVWSVIEMGLVLRRELFERIGGFDPDIGTGAPTPWQAGEATDVLLRLVDREPRLAAMFRWMPREASVGGVADAHGLAPAARRRKLRAYGRGLGRIVVRWRYPLWWRLAFIGGGLLFGVRHGRDYSPADGWWVFLGRLEGALGCTLGRGGTTTAVTR